MKKSSSQQFGNISTAMLFDIFHGTHNILTPSDLLASENH